MLRDHGGKQRQPRWLPPIPPSYPDRGPKYCPAILINKFPSIWQLCPISMNHSTDSQEQRPRKKIRHQGRLSGSLLSLTLGRLRGDGGAIFHSPQGVTFEQLAKGNNEFIDLEETISLYPTPAQVPEYLLPSREVLDMVKNSKGEVVRCPFCPSTFSGIVVKKSFKRHLQRHWNHAVAGKAIEYLQPTLPAPVISPVAHSVLDVKTPGNTHDYATSHHGAQQSSHALLTSTSTPLVTSTDHAPASGPLTPPKHSLSMLVHAAFTPKAPIRKKGRKSITTSMLGTVCKDSTTLAIARTMEALRSKIGIVFHRPDAHPNLEHQSFTRHDGQFLDVDATFSMCPTIDELPEGFWPTSHQYIAATPGRHRIRCLFCTWSFTGVYVKANFRGHVRYHWKLAAASKKANPIAPANAPLPYVTELSSYDPPASSFGPTKSSDLLQPDDLCSSKLTAAQSSSLPKIRSTRINQVASPGSLAHDSKASRPKGRKRSSTEASLVGDMSGSESTPAESVKKHAESLYRSVLLGIAQALSTVRTRPGAIFIPPEQSISYEELVLVVDRYFDIDKVAAVYRFVDHLPLRFWPSDETFEKAGSTDGSWSVRCPFCMVPFKGVSAKNCLKMHLQCHWWYASEQSDSGICAGTLASNIESVDTAYVRPSLNHPALPLPPSVTSMMQADMNLEKSQLSIIHTHTNLEINHCGDGTRPYAKEPRVQSTNPMTRAQEIPRYVWPVILH
jgi:hypothetical protein